MNINEKTETDDRHTQKKSVIHSLQLISIYTDFWINMQRGGLKYETNKQIFQGELHWHMSGN